MKLSELIADAERTMDEFGDMPVVTPDPGCSCCASDEFMEVTTRVERNSVRIWGGSDLVAIPAAFVVA
jgi:hypothetical protein